MKRLLPFATLAVLVVLGTAASVGAAPPHFAFSKPADLRTSATRKSVDAASAGSNKQPVWSTSIDRLAVSALAVPKIADTNRVIVGYRPQDSRKAFLSAASSGGRLIRTSKDGSFLVLRTPTGKSASSLAHELSSQPGVAYAEPDVRVHADFVPNDPDFSYQWGLSQIGAPTAWDTTRGSASIKIAVVDTGVDLSHPDLVGRLDTANDYDFVNGDDSADDDYGHGTHVAGIISATADNGIGIAGVANQCVILPIKVLGSNGSGYASDVADGITWAADHGASIINLSLGAAGSSQAENDAVQYAVAHDCVVVASAGNDDGAAVEYPAAFDNVVAVSSVGQYGSLSWFSDYGPKISVCAPGEDVLSTTYDGGYGYESGTSMAAPHVTGAVALVRSLHPTWTRNMAQTQVERTAVDLGDPGRDDLYGYGRINVADATGPAVVAVDDDIPGVALTQGTQTGSLDALNNDASDVYALPLKAGQKMRVSLSSPVAGSDFDLYVFGPDAGSIYSAKPLGFSAGLTYPETVAFAAPKDGTYYVAAYAYSGSGSYSLTSEQVPNDADDDIPGVPAATNPQTGSLDHPADPIDTYAIPIEAGQKVGFWLTGDEADNDFDLALYSPNSTSVYEDNPAAWSAGYAYPEHFSYTAPVTGTYYACCSAYSGSGTYSLSWVYQVRAGLSKPRISGKASARKGTKLLGAFTPGHSQRIKLEVQIYSKKRYKSYKSIWLTSGGGGSWSYRAKLKKASYRVRAISDETPAFSAAMSGWRKFSVGK